MTRTLRQSLASGLAVAAGVVSLAAARPADAQWGRVSNLPQGAQLLFEWQGRVDRETVINVGRTRPTVRGTNQNESRGRFTRFGQTPRGTGTLYVERVDGRGQVDVIQQMGENGRGDGVVRVRDPQGGTDTYAIRVFFRPDNNGGTYGNRGNGSRNDGTYGNGTYGDGTYGDGTYDRNDNGQYGRDDQGNTDRGNNGRGRANGRRRP